MKILGKFKVFDSKFKTGVIYNIGSFIIMGISGLLLNILIARYYDPWVLGVFNLFYAIYIFASQFAVMGIQQSTLRYVSLHYEDDDELSRIISVGLLITLISSSVVICILFLLRPFFVLIFHNREISCSIEYGLIGLLIFPLNKVLLAGLNGCRKMRLYAIGNSLRYIFIILSLIGAILFRISGEKIAFVFSISECLLLIYLITANKSLISVSGLSHSKEWFGKHIKFGMKGMGGGILNELNTRIDVLIMGMFLDAKAVGVYSFSAILAEGIGQLLVVFRSNYDPLIAQVGRNGNVADLKSLISNGRSYIYKLMILIGTLSILLYPIGVSIIVKSDEYAASWPVFAIFMLGIVARSGFAPFEGILQQSGHPGTQSLLVISVITVNILCNIILIPILGVIGGAIAIAISQVSFIFILKHLVKKRFGESVI